jgi:N-methylhydantoinase A/oxoprolinase/acetone carboxylase beta subunit
MYLEGTEYDLPTNLARLFISLGVGEEVKEKMIRRAPINTDMGEVPQIKIEDSRLEVEIISQLGQVEKNEYKRKILRMTREDLEEFIKVNELPIIYKPGWRLETLSARVLATLGL